MSILTLPPEIIREVAKNFIFGDDYKNFGLTCKIIYWAIKNRANRGQFQIYYGYASGMPFLFVDENDCRVLITSYTMHGGFCTNFEYFDIYPLTTTFSNNSDIDVNFTKNGKTIFQIEIRNFAHPLARMHIYISTLYGKYLGTGNTWAGGIFMGEDTPLRERKIFNHHKLQEDDIAQLSKIFKKANEGPVFKYLVIVIVKALNLLFEINLLE